MKFTGPVVALLLAFPFFSAAQKPAQGPLPPIPASVTYAPANPKLPTLFIVGDSVSHNWGPQALPFFDPSKINVVIAAESGRSARTLITEGLWDRIRANIKPHDIVTIQFGHNDDGPIVDAARSRGTLRGIGPETQEIDNPVTHKHETVLTFGGYMRKLIHDVQAAGATPIILSLTPRNEWVDGKIHPDKYGFGRDARSLAVEGHLDFVDINTLIAVELQHMGEAKAKPLFQDSVHMLPPNWPLYATWITEGLKGLPNRIINPYLSEKGQALPAITAGALFNSAPAPPSPSH